MARKSRRSPRADFESLVLRKKANGASIRGIASALGVSEWQVRCILRKDVTRKGRGQPRNKVRLKKVTKSKTGVTRAIVLSDIHIPEHDQAALAIALAYTKDFKPHIIVLNGDIMDMVAPSRFAKDPDDLTTLADEFQETKDFLTGLRKDHPDAEIIYTAGNHEYRINKYLLDQAPALASLPELAIDRLLGLDELDIPFKDDTNHVVLGRIRTHHGSIVKKHSGDSARGHMLKEGVSTLIGHIHKLGVVYRTDANGVHVAIENGHLSRPDPDYAGRCPDWQCGFTEVQFDKTGHSMVRQHHILKGRLVVDGVVYTA